MNSSLKQSVKLTFAAFLFSTLALTTACDKNSTSPEEETNISASQDAAESVASDIGQDTGGAVDQIADLSTVATAESKTDFIGLAKKSTQTKSYSAEYNSETGVWTITVIRNFLNNNYSADVSRIYEVQYLRSNGTPQMFFITRGDTADTVKLNIVEGTGKHNTMRLSQELKELSGSLTATGIKSGVMTVNGTYHRSAVDTLTTQNAVRTLDHTLDLTFTDITCPVEAKDDAYQYVSGTITGTYTATATFTSGDGYSDKTINRAIDVVLGDGQADITINGVTFFAGVEKGELAE